MSDGARIDGVRHSNVGLLTNEQLVLATQLDKEKWEDLLGNLREDLNDQHALFRLVYLIDDFAGTGTSFFRYNDKKQKWSGKLWRFKESIEGAREVLGSNPFDPEWELCVHHYIASAGAAKAIRERQVLAKDALAGDGWAKAVHISFGTVLPGNLPLGTVPGRDEPLIELTNTYYDPIIRTKHTDVGGAPHLGLGYGGCALPLVLDHNTPNNAVGPLVGRDGGRTSRRRAGAGDASPVPASPAACLSDTDDQPIREARHRIPPR